MASVLQSLDNEQQSLIETEVMESPSTAFAFLRDELYRSKDRIENWVTDMEDRLPRHQRELEDEMEECSAAVQSLRRADDEARLRKLRGEEVARQHAAQLENMREKVEELRVTGDKVMPIKVAELQTARSKLEEEVQVKQEEGAKRRVMKEEELNVLTRGVIFYQRLGLEFVGGDEDRDDQTKCLRIIFRQVCRCVCVIIIPEEQNNNSIQ
ncbi:unnamed protein product [Choristocarpus tenellus]